METNLKYRAIKKDAKKKMFIYRVQGGIWLGYYEQYDSFYLHLPKEVVVDINNNIKEIINPNYQIKTEDRDENGKEYSNVSFGVKLYELRDREDIKGKQSLLLQDAALKFSEYTFNKKNGLSKTLLDCIVSERKVNYFEQDDYFDAPAPASAASAPFAANEPDCSEEEDGLPF